MCYHRVFAHVTRPGPSMMWPMAFFRWRPWTHRNERRDVLLSVHSFSPGDENENIARLRSAGMEVVFGGPADQPCDLLPPSAFPGPPEVRPIPALRRRAGIGDSETGRNSRTVRWRFCSSCAGWPRPPTPAEFHEAVRAANPDRRQRAVLRTWLIEATNREIARVWIEEAYTWPMLVAAIHRIRYHRNALNYYLNGFARVRRCVDSEAHP